MPQSSTKTAKTVFAPVILRADAASDVLLVCEHASNHSLTLGAIWD